MSRRYDISVLVRDKVIDRNTVVDDDDELESGTVNVYVSPPWLLLHLLSGLRLRIEIRGSRTEEEGP